MGRFLLGFIFLPFILIEEYFISRKIKKLLLKAPQFPHVKILKADKNIIKCCSYMPPNNFSDKRVGEIRNFSITRLDQTEYKENSIVGVLPYKFKKNTFSVLLRLTDKLVTKNEFYSKLAVLL